MDLSALAPWRRARIIALTQLKNEARFLPGLLANLSPFVDGIVALDDGSTDATGEILAAHPRVIEVLRNPPGGVWDEPANRRALIQSGRRHRADWFLCMDADERIEKRFGHFLRWRLQRAELTGVQAYAFNFRELWGDTSHYRVDGIWGHKHRWRLFRNVPGHTRLDSNALHGEWLPLEILDNLKRVGCHSGVSIYHLRMLSQEDRRARFERYETLDPEHRFQSIVIMNFVHRQA